MVDLKMALYAALLATAQRGLRRFQVRGLGFGGVFQKVISKTLGSRMFKTKTPQRKTRIFWFGV